VLGVRILREVVESYERRSDELAKKARLGRAFCFCWVKKEIALEMPTLRELAIGEGGNVTQAKEIGIRSREG